jgi:uncharacterized protein YaaN involved in tellurite resistance
MDIENGNKSETSLAPVEPLQGEIVRPGEPVSPNGLNDGEAAGLKTQARELALELGAASGSREMILMDDLAGLGMQTQHAAAGELDLLRARMGEMLTRKDAGAEISRDLIGLRLALNEINPHELSKPGVLRRIFGGLPLVDKIPSPAQILETIAVRYETVSRQVQVIEIRLGEGRRLLARDNVELRKIYEQVEAQMLPVQKHTYFGELIMQELDRALAGTADPLKRERLQFVLHDVAMRVQDLRTMEQVFLQFFVSIDLTRQNNSRLAQSVERTLSLATNVVTVGLAIQTAMARQKRVLEATQKTQAFLGDMLAANAAAIRQQTQEIGDVYNNPVIALEKVTAAHDQLVEALDLVDQMQAAGIANARQNIARLAELSADLHQRALSMHGSTGSPEAKPPTIEAELPGKIS